LFFVVSKHMRLPTRKAEKEREESRQDDPHLTQEAFDRMTRELAKLQKDRILAAEEVARLAAMGDLSENAAYQYAKQHLRSMLSRSTRLEMLLARAIIILEHVSDDGIIRLGSVVKVQTGDKTYTWKILGEREVRPGQGQISHHSPVGNALLGHRVGDNVTVKLADRTVMYGVLEVY
jgi:transcription elongation factor GreA